ncbi:MAG: hypothetical protein ACM3ZE_02230, partial [Myxococcales bacterium]
WCAIGGTLGVVANRYVGAPGNVIRGVIAGALEDCRHRSGDRTVAVPLIGARWACPGSQPASLVGELWRGKTVLRYATHQVAISADLSTVELNHLDLLVPSSGHRGAMHLSVERARLHGAWPWARRTRLPGPWRAFYVSTLAYVFGTFAWFMARRREAPGYAEAVIAAMGATIGWLLLRWVDAHEAWSTGAYFAVPLGAIVALLGAERLASNARLRATENRTLLRYYAYVSLGWLVLCAWYRRIIHGTPRCGPLP